MYNSPFEIIDLSGNRLTDFRRANYKITKKLHTLIILESLLKKFYITMAEILRKD